MQPRFVTSALIAALLGFAAACSDQLPTLSGDEEFPEGTIPVTREVILPASEFFRFLGSYSGYSGIGDVAFQVVAADYEGLSAHGLNEFVGWPATVSYSHDGVEKRDSAFTYQDSRMVLRVDTTASTRAPVTLRVWAAAEPWDPATATWERAAVDSTGAPIPWTQPGGTRGALLGEGTWSGASTDSVVVTLSGSEVAALADSAAHGVIITVGEAGRRVQLSDVILRAEVSPDSAQPDTTLIFNVGTGATRTTVYTPDQPDPPAGTLAIGGIRGARALVEIDPRRRVPGCAVGVACDSVALADVRLNQVAVLLRPAAVPDGFGALAPVPVFVRTIEEPELGRNAPLGTVVSDAEVLFTRGDTLLQVPITFLAGAMARNDSFPISFALISQSPLSPAPPTFGVAFFQSDARLRIVYTLPTRRRLP